MLCCQLGTGISHASHSTLCLAWSSLGLPDGLAARPGHSDGLAAASGQWRHHVAAVGQVWRQTGDLGQPRIISARGVARLGERSGLGFSSTMSAENKAWVCLPQPCDFLQPPGSLGWVLDVVRGNASLLENPPRTICLPFVRASGWLFNLGALAVGTGVPQAAE